MSSKSNVFKAILLHLLTQAPSILFPFIDPREQPPPARKEKVKSSTSPVEDKQPKVNDTLDEFHLQKKKFKQLKKQQRKGENREEQVRVVLRGYCTSYPKIGMFCALSQN